MATTSSPIRIVIADEHPMARRSLRLLLDDEPGCEVVAEAAEVSMVGHYVHDHSPHVLVLDLHMGGRASLQLIRDLRLRAPGTAIVGVTMERSPSFALRVFEVGATGFVLKDRADAELAGAVRRAARGVRYASPCVSAGLERLRRPGAPSSPRVRTRGSRTAERALPAA
jgi:DNA-binding NarL/FixJ family response regulator